MKVKDNDLIKKPELDKSILNLIFSCFNRKNKYVVCKITKKTPEKIIGIVIDKSPNPLNNINPEIKEEIKFTIIEIKLTPMLLNKPELIADIVNEKKDSAVPKNA